MWAIGVEEQDNVEYSSPLTSFDWNIEDPNIIGTSSIDTTCTIWDIEKRKKLSQLIAHDAEVYDICFSNNSFVFGTVSADGSARQFDTRYDPLFLLSLWFLIGTWRSATSSMKGRRMFPCSESLGTEKTTTRLPLSTWRRATWLSLMSEWPRVPFWN